MSRYLRPYGDSSKRITKMATSTSQPCQSGLSVTSSGSPVFFLLGPSETNTNVKVYIKDELNNDWYLKVDAVSSEVWLECQSAVNNVSSFSAYAK